MCIRDRASHENQNALPVAKLGLGNPALAPHRRLIDSTINRAGLRNLDGWERQLNLVTASQDDKRQRGVIWPSLLRAHSPGSFREDFLRDFAQRDVEFEHGRFRAAAPPGHFPMSADKLDLWPRRQIEQQRNFLAIELLRKSRNRLGIPRHTCLLYTSDAA